MDVAMERMRRRDETRRITGETMAKMEERGLDKMQHGKEGGGGGRAAD